MTDIEYTECIDSDEYGKADKKQIQQMVKMLLRMEEIPKPDDAADAIACAITHCQAGRMREQFRMK